MPGRRRRGPRRVPRPGRPHRLASPGPPGAASAAAVLTDIHVTPEGPRYATRKDFVYGEDVTIADWTVSTQDLPLYQEEGQDQG
ncbi:hypothetical protein B9W62_19025 [Streptomyces sp. CS113]|nr:hypothetical protein B9W62_19025 [Streptomyces sp. CS113]